MSSKHIDDSTEWFCDSCSNNTLDGDDIFDYPKFDLCEDCLIEQFKTKIMDRARIPEESRGSVHFSTLTFGSNARRELGVLKCSRDLHWISVTWDEGMSNVEYWLHWSDFEKLMEEE